jgi:hypothetical protein
MLVLSVGAMPWAWVQVLIMTAQVGVEGAMLSVEAARVYVHS